MKRWVDEQLLNTKFTAGQAAKAAGVQYHQLDYMAKSRLLVPSVSEANGSNTCRVYGFRDVVAMKVADQLRCAGVGLPELRKVVHQLQSEQVEEPLEYLTIACDGEVQTNDFDGLMSFFRQGSLRILTVFALSDTVNEVASAVRGLTPPTRGKAMMALK